MRKLTIVTLALLMIASVAMPALQRPQKIGDSKVKEERKLIISRTYERASDRHQLFIASITGDDIVGSVFQYEIWLNNNEQTGKRVRSGNEYHVRRAFIDKLLDLHEAGWERKGSGTFGTPDEGFFDPAKL
jgi:hypothetical protein